MQATLTFGHSDLLPIWFSGCRRVPKHQFHTRQRRSKDRKKSLESSTFDAFEARAFINSRLSKQVAQNMGRPALENRTGRFANSVNVVNATKYGDVTNID